MKIRNKPELVTAFRKPNGRVVVVRSSIAVQLPSDAVELTAVELAEHLSTREDH